MQKLRKIYRNPFKSLLPRKFQVYCVGAAKTGSTSLASMFASYRAAHEPDTIRTNQLVIDWLEQKIERSDMERRFHNRDRRLKLELESSHPLGYVSDILAQIFPDAKFIITIREPYSWLESRLNFHYQTDPPVWKAYRKYFWTDRHSGYAPEETLLMNFGLCSLDTYLSQYADHYARVFSNIPEERSLVLKTSQLSQSIAKIADFLGVKESTIRLAHSKKSPNKIQPLKEMNPQFVKSKIYHHCHDLITEQFPNNISDYQ